MEKKIKLQLEFKFYLRQSVNIKISHISESLRRVGEGTKLCIADNGHTIETGYVINYKDGKFIIPTYVKYDESDINNPDLQTFIIFSGSRRESLRDLYKCMVNLSQ